MTGVFSGKICVCHSLQSANFFAEIRTFIRDAEMKYEEKYEINTEVLAYCLLQPAVYAL